MTGFGRATFLTDKGRIVVEIQALNRKFLDVVLSFPKEFFCFEVEVRKAIAERIFRGQLTVRMELYPDEEKIESFLPDVEFLALLKKGWEKAAQKLKLSKEEINLNFLMQQNDSFSVEVLKEDEVEKWRKILFLCLNKALESVIEMKVKEGENIKADLKKRLAKIGKGIVSIERRAPEIPLQYKEKLQKRMAELFEVSPGDERIFKEAALFAERCDITEEIVRTKSHLQQFDGLLNTATREVGRRLDFLVQEIGREINTIAAKSADVSISEQVIELKSELEKIREQIQNVE